MKKLLFVLCSVILFACSDTEDDIGNLIFYDFRAYDFSQNFFFLSTSYKSVYRDFYTNPIPVIPESAAKTRVKEIEVWFTTGDIHDVHNNEAVALADLESKNIGESYDPELLESPISLGQVERGRFELLEASEYNIDRNLGILEIINLRFDRTYAVAYRIEGESEAPEDDLFNGTLKSKSGEGDTLLFKLIYRPNMQPQFDTLWNRQIRNIYKLPGSNYNPDRVNINIYYEESDSMLSEYLPGTADKLIYVLETDRLNNVSGEQISDGKFDLIDPLFVSQNGRIMFRDLEPFRQSIKDYFFSISDPDKADIYVFHEVYDTTYDVARRKADKDKYVIHVETYK